MNKFFISIFAALMGLFVTPCGSDGNLLTVTENVPALFTLTDFLNPMKGAEKGMRSEIKEGVVAGVMEYIREMGFWIFIAIMALLVVVALFAFMKKKK